MKKGCRICQAAIVSLDYKKKEKQRKKDRSPIAGNGDEMEEEVSREERREPV